MLIQYYKKASQISSKFYKTALTFLFILAFLHLKPQTQETINIEAHQISSPIKLDGNLDEDEWSKVKKIQNFIQREQQVGQPATEQTDVAVLYDKNNLYIGVWCYQKDQGSIRAKYMERDFDYEADDNFKVIISTFNDGKNGYLFIINPNGARADAQVYGIEESNMNWNGVWDVESRINELGWFAEIVIPFSTFQFKNAETLNWGINFERSIVSKNEEVTWQGWNQNYSINSLSAAGTLVGINNIGYSKRFELKPYLLSSFEKERNIEAKYPAKYGFDLNINLTPTLKLNVTTNTDFAQVEADRVAINLTRFNLYYPEKRDFFLEGYNQFSFKFGYTDDLFYTRKIGIENFEPVPIMLGARLVGKIGRNNINFLSIQTEKSDSIPSTNNTVFRYKYDIGSQSYIGGIITSKVNPNYSNLVIGLDAKFSTSRFLKNKNLIVYGSFAKSFDDLKSDNQSKAFRIYVDYPNDFMDQYLGFTGVYENFNPALGFFQRTNYEYFRYNFRLTPRWLTRWGINKLLLQPWGINLYLKPETGTVETFENQFSPFGFRLKSGDSFEFHLKQAYDNLDASFELTDDIMIEKDDYWMHQTEVEISSYDARKIWFEATAMWGGFYRGRIQNYDIEIGINVNKNLNFTNTYSYNFIELPAASVKTHELASKINYAFNPKLNLALFTQYNSLDELLFFNFRLHWIPKVGSDLYLVYNHELDEVRSQLHLLKPSISSGAVKIVWRFTF